MRSISKRDVIVGISAATVATVLLFGRTAQSESSSGALRDCYQKRESNKSDVVTCNEGDVLVGGGGDCYGDPGNWHSFLVGNMPEGKNGWKTTCQSVQNGKSQIYANSYAVCCKK